MSKYRIIDEELVDEDLRVKIILCSDSPFWKCQYNIPGVGQKRKSLRTRSKKVARKKGRVIARRLELGELDALAHQKTTVQEAIDAHHKRMVARNRRPGTLRDYCTKGRRLLSYCRKRRIRELKDLTVAVLEDLEDELREGTISPTPKPDGPKRAHAAKPLSPKSVRDQLKFARSIIKTALRRRMIVQDPALGYELPPAKAADVEILNADVLTHLFAVDDTYMVDVYRFLVLMCLRINELICLTKDDVLLDDHGRPRAIWIRCKTCPLTGEALQPKHGVERLLPLYADAIEIVERQMKASPSCWVFHSAICRQAAEGRWSYEALLDRLHKDLEAGGFEKRGFHGFRHTGASYLVNVGRMPLPQLQKLLGHKHLSTTQVYLHANVDDIAATLKGVDFTNLIMPSVPETTEDKGDNSTRSS